MCSLPPLAGLRRLIHIKNKELKHMKSLAATILTQRSETEQFFLEALQEVKEVVARERQKKTAQETRAMQNKLRGGAGATGGEQKGGIFPPLNIKSANLHMLERKAPSSALQLGELGRVAIQDLSWPDKELVLRVLFSKMNGAHSSAAQQAQTRAMGGNNRAVFISEGALLPSSEEADDEAARYQGSYEVRLGGLGALDYDEDDDLQYRGAGARGGGGSENSSFVNDSATLSRHEDDSNSLDG